MRERETATKMEPSSSKLKRGGQGEAVGGGRSDEPDMGL